MNVAIELKCITKYFKNTCVLENISVEFEKEKIHGVIGRNGSGKSVMLKIICGLLFPDEGVVIVGGKKIGEEIAFPQNIGAIIEAPGFAFYQSGFQNLKYLASIRNIINNEKIKETMCVVGLNPNDKKKVGKYSLGMRQRLGIAQAIMEDPDILLLDEPMNGLDSEGVEDVRKLLLELKNNKKTIILASHSIEDIKILCDTVTEIERGRIKKTKFE